jgi:hypothetical protein
MAISNDNFYVTLPVMEDFFDASNRQNYHSLPGDWHVAVTDIVDSTAAIKDNRYKTVNILGASPIVGILNIADRNKIPYTFGGDGSVFCIPSVLLDDARRVLGSSRQIGKVEYNLDLRAAIIPVSYIRKQGHDIQVARYRASQHYVQAIFSGGGISYAEEILKDPEIEQFRIPALDNAETIDFTGLECRWQEVKQKDNEVLTLLIKSNPSVDQLGKVYKKVLHKMRDIFGFEDKTNPINVSQLSMNLSYSELLGEAKFRTFGKGWLKRLGYILKIQLQIIIGKILMAFDYKSSVTDWSLYKSDLVRNSDHRKFDDMLRVVISGHPSQRKKFTRFLDQKYQEEDLAYGIHITDAAVITCMVFRYHREHVHFVDGSGGGYVSASKELKQRMEALKHK